MSQGIIANGFIFTSGAVGKDPVTGDIVKGPIEARTVSASYTHFSQCFPRAKWSRFCSTVPFRTSLPF
jgi:enamine deaminase RidA (YjgF/YER057c/UK114 family)